MATRRGDTLIFQTPPVIAAHAAVGGKKEGEGPLAAGFDALSADNRFGQSGWEAAETQLQLRAARLCLKKAQTTEKEVSLALAGDLQAQCTASNYAMRALGIPYAGLFGACSTMAEALGLGAALCSAGLADGLLAMASSHFCTAERQFRTPLSYGAVRTPTAQWTATAAGACLLRPAGQGVGIRAVTFGRVQDYQIRDINNMGAAMAPAASATLLHYLRDTHAEPPDFDAIYTGDLGHVGSQLFRELLAAEGLLIKNHVDCGCILYDANEQAVKSGGSGAGCCAAVLCAHILPRLERGTQKRVLFLATGALMSQTTFLQKERLGRRGSRAVGPRLVRPAGRAGRVRGHRAAAGLRPPAGQRRPHRIAGGGGHRHPHRRAPRRCRRHHHPPRLRRGLLLGRPEPRPELARNKKRRCFAPVRARRVVGCKKTKTPAPESWYRGFVRQSNCDQAFLLARFAIRLILRLAVFFLMTPLARALSIAETAARTVASLSAAFASMAASAFLTTVFRLVLMALL